MKLILPWPPSILSPNRREHWAEKAPFKNKYRYACGLIAMKEVPEFPDGKIDLKITFYPPHNKMDDDNIIGCFKAGRDGIADGWGVNDKRFRPIYSFGDSDKSNPRVEIEIDSLHGAI